jgi:hypothetical protein
VADAVALDRLQRWMQAVVTHPSGARAGAAGEEARAALELEIEDLVLPSARLAAVERIGVYADMYHARLVEALEEDYPALHACLGCDAFDALARAYVTRHPSRHYSLNVLGARLPAFVRDEAPASTVVEPRAFLFELATLELAVQQAFDAPEAAPLAADALLAVPPEAWAGARLAPIPALRLFAFEHPVDAWYQAFREGEQRPLPAREPSWLAVWRGADDRVWRRDLSRLEYALLGALVAGAPLADALERALADAEADAQALGASVHRWMRTWAADGLFRAVERAE